MRVDSSRWEEGGHERGIRDRKREREGGAIVSEESGEDGSSQM